MHVARLVHYWLLDGEVAPAAWPGEIQEEESIPGGILRQNFPGFLQMKESRYSVTPLRATVRQKI